MKGNKESKQERSCEAFEVKVVNGGVLSGKKKSVRYKNGTLKDYSLYKKKKSDIIGGRPSIKGIFFDRHFY